MSRVIKDAAGRWINKKSTDHHCAYANLHRVAYLLEEAKIQDEWNGLPMSRRANFVLSSYGEIFPG